MVAKESFLTEAERLLAVGKPHEAREMLWGFRPNFKKPSLPPADYWWLACVSSLMCGDMEGGLKYADEIGGFSEQLYNAYENAFVAFSTRRPRWNRSRRSHERLVKLNLRQLISLAQDLPVVPMDRLPRWTQSA